jgi:hypothetical protein
MTPPSALDVVVVGGARRARDGVRPARGRPALAVAVVEKNRGRRAPERRARTSYVGSTARARCARALRGEAGARAYARRRGIESAARQARRGRRASRARRPARRGRANGVGSRLLGKPPPRAGARRRWSGAPGPGTAVVDFRRWRRRSRRTSGTRRARCCSARSSVDHAAGGELVVTDAGPAAGWSSRAPGCSRTGSAAPPLAAGIGSCPSRDLPADGERRRGLVRGLVTRIRPLPFLGVHFPADGSVDRLNALLSLSREAGRDRLSVPTCSTAVVPRNVAARRPAPRGAAELGAGLGRGVPPSVPPVCRPARDRLGRPSRVCGRSSGPENVDDFVVSGSRVACRW